MPPYEVRISPNRGVVGAAPYRVCANIAGKHFVDRRGGFYILPP